MPSSLPLLPFQLHCHDGYCLLHCLSLPRHQAAGCDLFPLTCVQRLRSLWCPCSHAACSGQGVGIAEFTGPDAPMTVETNAATASATSRCVSDLQAIKSPHCRSSSASPSPCRAPEAEHGAPRKRQPVDCSGEPGGPPPPHSDSSGASSLPCSDLTPALLRTSLMKTSLTRCTMPWGDAHYRFIGRGHVTVFLGGASSTTPMHLPCPCGGERGGRGGDP